MWFGHVKRRDQDYVGKKTLEREPPGRRKKGRPKQIWMDCVNRRRKKHDHVTPLLKELHWLPIHVRPTYKLLTIAYSVMHGLAPEYLAELLDRHRPRRVLRSASAELFSVPFSQTVRHGDRRFSVAVATLWNQLPNSVRMIETLPLFRTHLKTHLFRVAFS